MARSRYEPDSGYVRSEGIFRNETSNTDGADSAESADTGVGDAEKQLSVSELLYSSSSYYAIAKPGE